jgi:hypothetical protein
VRIGINALYLLPGQVGGSEIYIRNLVKQLAAASGETTYVIFVNKESEGIFDSVGPNVQAVTCPIQASNRPLRIIWSRS